MYSSLSLPYLVALIFIFLIGACIGSFLNLVIYRLPLNISIVYPRSHCPSCKQNIPIFALIPIIGYFLTAGRCFICKTQISKSYVLIETFCASVTLLLFVHYFSDVEFLNIILNKHFNLSSIFSFITSLWLLYTGVVLSVIDIRYRILPDIITIPGMLIGVLLCSLNPLFGYMFALKGLATGFLGLFIVTKIYEIIRKREGMGFGDVKYLGFIGAVVGVYGVFFTLFIACIIGSIIGIIYGILSKKGLSVSIPFGPFLAVSALLVFLYLT
jgi:leader peptidase (prepilin peptidase)/N-methyltransferase